MTRVASDPEQINLAYFLAIYLLALWLLSFFVRFRTYYKLRGVLQAEQKAVDENRVDETLYGGTFKGWELDADQEEWLEGCRLGIYTPTWANRKQFAALKAAEPDPKLRMQRRTEIQRRFACLDPEVVYNPSCANILRRMSLLHRLVSFRFFVQKMFETPNPFRDTGLHVNYYHLDGNTLFGRNLTRAVGDTAEGKKEGDNIPIQLHALNISLAKTTVTIGDLTEADCLQKGSEHKRESSTGMEEPTSTTTASRIRRRTGKTPSTSPTLSPAAAFNGRNATFEGESPPTSTLLGASGSAFGLSMRRQDTIRCDGSVREAMREGGRKVLRIDVDVHRDISIREVHVAALLVVSRQELVVELWNSITRRQSAATPQDGGLLVGSDQSHSNVERTSADVTPAGSSPDFSPPIGDSGSGEVFGSSLYKRRTKSTGGLTVDTGPEEGEQHQFSELVQQVSSASVGGSAPVSLVRGDRERRARIADDALSITVDNAAPPNPHSPVATSPPQSALQGAFRKVSFLHAFYPEQIEQMEMSLEAGEGVLFPLVLVVEHRPPRGRYGPHGAPIGGGVALVYCGRIIGSESPNTREVTAESAALVLDFRLEYVRMGGQLFRIELPVFNVGAPGSLGRQVPLPQPPRRADSPPFFVPKHGATFNPETPTTPWGVSQWTGSPHHGRSGSFMSCASQDSSHTKRHIRTSSLHTMTGSVVSEDDGSLCVVCFEESRSVVFLPCGHFAVCSTCCPQLASCPVCRSAINEVLVLGPPPAPPGATTPGPPQGGMGEGDSQGAHQQGGTLDRLLERLREIPRRVRAECAQSRQEGNPMEMHDRGPPTTPPPPPGAAAAAQPLPPTSTPARHFIDAPTVVIGTPRPDTDLIPASPAFDSTELDGQFRSVSSFSEEMAQFSPLDVNRPPIGSTLPPPEELMSDGSIASQDNSLDNTLAHIEAATRPSSAIPAAVDGGSPSVHVDPTRSLAHQPDEGEMSSDAFATPIGDPM